VNFKRYCLASGAALALAGCAGSGAPSTSPAQSVQSDAIASKVKKNTSLYVGNTNIENVTVYETDGSGPIQTIKKAINLPPVAIVFDGKSNLYVAGRGRGSTGVVSEYAYGQTKLLRKLKVVQPRALAVDGADNLYVLGLKGVEVFAPGASTPSETVTTGIKNPRAMVLDKSGKIYVANYDNGNNVTVYAASGSLIRTITQGISYPQALAINKKGWLYVANYPNVTVYQPGKSTPFKTIAIGPASCLALDADQNVYVGDSGGISVFSAAPDLSNIHEITAGINDPESMAFDSQGDLFVANYQGNSVTKYLPGSGVLDATVTNGVDFPYVVAVK
jgi:hypothetical protein